MDRTTKAKGDLLEQVVTQLCSGIQNARTEHNVKVIGGSGVSRQIDTLITGKMGAFEVKIAIDSKNHSAPVDINYVESTAGMLTDISANLGVIVCPSGFTEGAKKRADLAGIQLYEIYDEALGNANLFIRVRYIEARIDQYAFNFSHKSSTSKFAIMFEQSRWIIHVDGKAMRADQVPYYLWNRGDIAQKAGEYTVDVGAVKLADTIDPNYSQYCDLKVMVKVVEDHFLKLFPASSLQRTNQPQKHIGLRIDIYPLRADMIQNGWIVADAISDPKASIVTDEQGEMQEWVMRGVYSVGLDGTHATTPTATLEGR